MDGNKHKIFINLYGIAHLVSYRITHCDLKPENILMIMNFRSKNY